jgi:hypothetical protein
MKLVDLEPKWFTLGWSTFGANHVGLTFKCPHCLSIRLAVNFEDIGSGKIWEKTGDDFTNISFYPSINAEQSGHWHGWIINGEIK